MRAQAKDLMGDAFKSGNFALAEVKYAAGDIKPMVIESVGTAQVRSASKHMQDQSRSRVTC